MNIRKLHHTLARALTHYHNANKRRKDYCQQQYAESLERLQEVIDDIQRGATVKPAIVAGFTGPLRNVCLTAAGETWSSEDWVGWEYQPVIPRPREVVV